MLFNITMSTSIHEPGYKSWQIVKTSLQIWFIFESILCPIIHKVQITIRIHFYLILTGCRSPQRGLSFGLLSSGIVEVSRSSQQGHRRHGLGNSLVLSDQIRPLREPGYYVICRHLDILYIFRLFCRTLVSCIQLFHSKSRSRVLQVNIHSSISRITAFKF